MSEIKHCARCSKAMSFESGQGIDTLIGISIAVNITAPIPVQKKEFMELQMGKYELGKKYEFCYECWLDSLFGRSA